MRHRPAAQSGGGEKPIRRHSTTATTTITPLEEGLLQGHDCCGPPPPATRNPAHIPEKARHACCNHPSEDHTWPVTAFSLHAHNTHVTVL